MNQYKTHINVACWLASALFFISCNPSAPSALTETDKQYFRDVTYNVQVGWNKGDREPYAKRFSADAVYMAPNREPIIGQDAIRTFANTFPEVKIEYTILEIMGSAEYAYVRGSFVVTNPADSLLDKGKYLSVWRKFPDGNWQLTHDIFSSDLAVVVK